MSYTIEGTIEIPMEDWFSFLEKYVPGSGAEIVYGAPSQECGYISVPFAAGTESDPREWRVKPSFLQKT